jgi:hypothetical protein
LLFSSLPPSWKSGIYCGMMKITALNKLTA